METLNGIEAIRSRVNSEWGRSDWLLVTQERINQFAKATSDHQWIHVDVERTRTGPYGSTIAHGFLTLSLVPALLDDVVKIEGHRMAINYGLNRVRFPSPVLSGARIRATLANLSVDDIDGGLQVLNRVTIEIEHEAKPACVAEIITRYYF